MPEEDPFAGLFAPTAGGVMPMPYQPYGAHGGFPQHVSGLPQIGGAQVPQAPSVNPSPPGTMRRLFAAVAPLAIGAGATLDLQASPTQPFKPQRGYIDAASAAAALQFNNIRIATFSLNVTNAPLPVDFFLRDAVGSDLSGYTAGPGVAIVVNTTNPSGGAVTPELGFVGWSYVEG